MSNSNDRKRVKVSEDLLKGLKNDHPHSDVKIILDDGEIEASKFVLSSRSEYFERMFDNDHQFRESRENAVTVPYKKIVMKKVIEYLYGGELNIDGLSMVEAMEYLDLLRLMMFNDEFDIIERKLITQVISRSYRPGDYIPAMKLAIAKELDQHPEQLMYAIFEEENLETILKDHSEDIKELSVSLIMSILKEVKDSVPEINKFRFFKIWSESEDRDFLMVRVIAKVSFDLLRFSVEELLGEVKKSSLFNDAHIDEAVVELYKNLENQHNDERDQNARLERLSQANRDWVALVNQINAGVI